MDSTGLETGTVQGAFQFEYAPHGTAVGLCVSDLERSLRFYCEGLGFERAEGYDLDDTMLPGLDRALEVAGPVRMRSQMITHGDLKISCCTSRPPCRPARPRSDGTNWASRMWN